MKQRTFTSSVAGRGGMLQDKHGSTREGRHPELHMHPGTPARWDACTAVRRSYIVSFISDEIRILHAETAVVERSDIV